MNGNTLLLSLFLLLDYMSKKTLRFLDSHIFFHLVSEERGEKVSDRLRRSAALLIYLRRGEEDTNTHTHTSSFPKDPQWLDGQSWTEAKD